MGDFGIDFSFRVIGKKIADMIREGKEISQASQKRVRNIIDSCRDNAISFNARIDSGTWDEEYDKPVEVKASSHQKSNRPSIPIGEFLIAEGNSRGHKKDTGYREKALNVSIGKNFLSVGDVSRGYNAYHIFAAESTKSTICKERQLKLFQPFCCLSVR